MCVNVDGAAVLKIKSSPPEPSRSITVVHHFAVQETKTRDLAQEKRGLEECVEPYGATHQKQI